MPIFEAGELAAGSYTLNASAIGAGDDAWAYWDFDLTFGLPDVLPVTEPNNAVVFAQIEPADTLESLGATANTGDDGSVSVVTEGERTVLDLFDPGDDSVGVAWVVDVDDIFQFRMHRIPASG